MKNTKLGIFLFLSIFYTFAVQLLGYFYGKTFLYKNTNTMKQYYKLFSILISLLFIVFACRTQQDARFSPPPIGNGENLYGDNSCFLRYHVSTDERKNIYPFSKATSVKLVSFEYDINRVADDGYLFSSSLHRFLPVQYRESIALSNEQIDSLTNLLYNYDFRAMPSKRGVPKCYRPRNGIVFYDVEGSQFAAIEICFECQRFMTFPEKVILPEQRSLSVDFCTQKSDMLRDFFKSSGVYYGAKYVK